MNRNSLTIVTVLFLGLFLMTGFSFAAEECPSEAIGEGPDAEFLLQVKE